MTWDTIQLGAPLPPQRPRVSSGQETWPPLPQRPLYDLVREAVPLPQCARHVDEIRSDSVSVPALSRLIHLAPHAANIPALVGNCDPSILGLSLLICYFTWTCQLALLGGQTQSN